MPESKSWRNSPVGNIVILAATTVIVLAVVWFVGFARGGDNQDVAAEGAEGQASSVDIPDTGQPAPEVGEAAPQFTATTLDGKEFDLANLGGKPAWIVFNATWCANCRAEIPDVEETFDKAGDRVQILSVYVSDTESAVADYSQKLGLTYPQVVDSGNSIAALYRVVGLPTHYFIDGDGTVNQVRVGTLSPALIDESLAGIGVKVG